MSGSDATWIGIGAIVTLYALTGRCNPKVVVAAGVVAWGLVLLIEGSAWLALVAAWGAGAIAWGLTGGRERRIVTLVVTGAVVLLVSIYLASAYLYTGPGRALLS
ncbi:MAG: hypothetical protein F4128_10490 [Gammaproteobacteria bacterium]|nr:hypothetical protein [Gammaproteobacteria bacterium]